MSDHHGMTEMGEMSFDSLMRWVNSLEFSESISGCAVMECGHWTAFMRIHGVTTLLSHGTEADAVRLVRAASALIDVLDAICVENGGAIQDQLGVAEQIFNLGRDVPPSPDA